MVWMCLTCSALLNASSVSSPSKPLAFRREGNVVIGGEVLQVDPALPGRGQADTHGPKPSADRSPTHFLPGRQIRIRDRFRRPCSASRLTQSTGVEELNGSDSILPSVVV